ncbi:Glucose N-acetyltransferase 1 [Ceratocystis fimbriata CBS 114723]|uniref:Glucose N-acetyltransferase 1 n=1 Tax=Ceratocystis fimbriata CBS 114723 TaxID=1035309 RepID=A0A2C5XB95_9PEZI|nr:Glucose N-acetyltransferase 1 [Ceratocystis fimbriata CBS 114723]
MPFSYAWRDVASRCGLLFRTLVSTRRGLALLMPLLFVLIFLRLASLTYDYKFGSLLMEPPPQEEPTHDGPVSGSVSTPPNVDPPTDSLRVPAWSNPVVPEGADWSRFAIVQYATNLDYLCNSLMVFDSLRKLNTKADLVLLYPEDYAPIDIKNPESNQEKLIVKARDEYGVKLHPIKVIRRAVLDSTWAASYSKLFSFNLTAYDRVLSIDSDGLVLQNLDELFFAPPATVAAPLAYWLRPGEDVLSSQMLLIQPSAEEFARISQAIDGAPNSDYDMEIINHLYRQTALILPHRPYDLLTSEFRILSIAEHARYLSNADNIPSDDAVLEPWDPMLVYNEVKYLHFSDWPMPKPWTRPTQTQTLTFQPKCVEKDGTMVDCTAQRLWVGFYEDFLVQRSRVCLGM